MDVLESVQDDKLKRDTRGLERRLLVNLGGETFQAGVDESGAWSVQISDADLQDLDSNVPNVDVQVTDAKGGAVKRTTTVQMCCMYWTPLNLALWNG